MRAALLLLCCLMPLPSVRLWAEDAAIAKAQKVYEGLMSDGDLYAGEGVVTLATYGGDLEKAKASGRERARGNLVENIKVRIVSRTTDTQRSDGKTSQESVEAVSSSTADLELENIQYKVLEGYPKAGQLTVVATLSKEEYFRQQDNRRLSYRPLHALRLWGGIVSNALMENAEADRHNLPPGGVSPAMNRGESSQPEMSFGGDFYWHSWFVGLGVTMARNFIYIYDASDPSVTNRYLANTSGWNDMRLKLGYDWTPWATRVQLVIPVQAEVGYMNWDPNFAWSMGVAGGARLRYWVTDRMAFDISGLLHQGVSSATLSDRSGKPLRFSPEQEAKYEMTGPEITLGVLWNGF